MFYFFDNKGEVCVRGESQKNRRVRRGREEHVKQEGWCGYMHVYACVSVILTLWSVSGSVYKFSQAASSHAEHHSAAKRPHCWTSSLKQTPGSTAAMSRRRVSVKDLGAVDCQGWLLRKKEGRSFLGSKWRRYWFVLKESSLYWYTDKMAEKAEGFINLSGFTIEQAKQCRKKHAMTASHPLVVTIFIAAESFTDMNKWISKLSEAAKLCDLIDTEECYSEDSDQDGDDCASTCSLNSEQETADAENGNVPQPLCESSPSASIPPTTTTAESRRRSTSEGATLSRHRRRRGPSEGGERLSWLDLPGPDGAGGEVSLPVLQITKEKEEEVDHEKPPDEMESLYNHLKAASLSPTGQSSRRDFRASFIRRCQNEKLNEKLHMLRILRSTLKAKESELLAVEQILTDHTLTAPTYRKWRTSNPLLLQEIAQRYQAAGGTAELRPQAADTLS